MLEVAAWTLGSLPACAIAFGLLERRFGARAAPPRTRGELARDLACWVFVPLLTALALERLGLDARLRGAALTRAGELPVWLQAALALLLADLVGYATHRAFHSRVLYRWHALHHARGRVDWLAAGRMHPINDLLSAAARTVLLGLVGFDLGALAPYLPLVLFHLVFIHADLPIDFGPLRWVLVSPAFHRHHHTQAGGRQNLASIFPWIDAAFGTAEVTRRARDAASQGELVTRRDEA